MHDPVTDTFSQRTHGPVNAHLISGPSISTKQANLDLHYSLSFSLLYKLNSRSQDAIGERGGSVVETGCLKL